MGGVGGENGVDKKVFIFFNFLSKFYPLKYRGLASGLLIILTQLINSLGAV